MTDSPRRPTSTVPILLAIATFSLLSISAALSSEGFLEADSITHYQYARFAFQRYHLLVNIWGRPICTGLYAIPALLCGRIGVQFTSLLLAIGCGLIAWRIAKQQKYRYPELALIFTLAQPLVFLHSFSELTELPFAFLLGLAFWAYQRRQWLAMAVLVALLPLSRPEGFGFIFLAALALLMHRRVRWLAVLPVPLILWSLAGWRFSGYQGVWWKWLIDNWPYAATSLYARGPFLFWMRGEHGELVFSFLLRLPVVASPLIFPFLCIGIFKSIQRRTSDAEEFHRRTVQILIAAIPLLILLGHSALYALGKMASNGELRYLLIVAPFWGLLSARGWEWTFDRLSWSSPIRWAGVAALVPVLLNLTYRVVPLRADDDLRHARTVVQWYQSSGAADAFPRMATALPGIYYYLGQMGTEKDRALDWQHDLMMTPPPGTIVIWHPIYAIFNSDQRRQVPLADLINAGWIDVTDQVPAFAPDWHVLVSPTDSHARAGPEALRSLSHP